MQVAVQRSELVVRVHAGVGGPGHLLAIDLMPGAQAIDEQAGGAQRLQLSPPRREPLTWWQRLLVGKTDGTVFPQDERR